MKTLSNYIEEKLIVNKNYKSHNFNFSAHWTKRERKGNNEFNEYYSSDDAEQELKDILSMCGERIPSEAYEDDTYKLFDEVPIIIGEYTYATGMYDFYIIIQSGHYYDLYKIDYYKDRQSKLHATLCVKLKNFKSEIHEMNFFKKLNGPNDLAVYSFGGEVLDKFIDYYTWVVNQTR